MAKHVRPRPSNIDLLPEECESIVAWAAQELRNPKRSQTEIYAEFRHKLIAIQGELGIGFAIPSFSAFNRYAVERAELMRRHERALMLSQHVVSENEGKSDDAVTRAASMTLKTLILEMLVSGGEDGFNPKEALAMAGALRNLQIAENLSTVRRQKVQSEFEARAEKVIDSIAKEAGLSASSISQLRREFLGVRPTDEQKPAGEA